MTIRDALLRERRLLAARLERLEAALRADEETARRQTQHQLFLLVPCLEAHLGLEHALLGARPRTHRLGPPSLSSLLEDLRCALRYGDEQPFARYRDFVLRLVSEVRARLAADGAAPGRPARSLRRDVVRRVRELERQEHGREAALEHYVRPSRR